MFYLVSFALCLASVILAGYLFVTFPKRHAYAEDDNVSK